MPSYRDARHTVVHPDRCRRLRREQTDAERKLWWMLRDRRIADAKFRRQHEFGPYVLDFFCAEKRLVIEADGGQHFLTEGMERDRVRDDYLASRGLRVLRFTNREILATPDSVEEEIRRRLGEVPSPCPLPEGEGSCFLMVTDDETERCSSDSR